MEKNRRPACLAVGESFFMWLMIAGAVGSLLGCVGAVFHHAVDLSDALRRAHPWILFTLPLAGAAIALLYRLAGMENDPGTNLVLRSVRSVEQMHLRQAPLIFIGTVLTHLAGGSSGREGAALQLGGSITADMGRRLQLDEKDRHILTLCGMSAGFAALFGTPLTAAIFAIEVVSVGIMHYAALVPCLFSALVAYGVGGALGVHPTAFDLGTVPDFTFLNGGRVLVLGVLCALLGIVFCQLLHSAAHWYQKYLKDPVLRAVVGGLLVLAVSLLLGSQDYNGAGMPVIRQAIAGQARPEAFLIKMLLTALTLGAGFKGGEIVPTFFVGATFGCTVGALLGLDPGFAAAVGIVALFCSVVNCPVASLVLSIELYGSQGALFFAVACAVSYMLSGNYGLYAGQKIVYSKTRAEFIDQPTH